MLLYAGGPRSGSCALIVFDDSSFVVSVVLTTLTKSDSMVEVKQEATDA